MADEVVSPQFTSHDWPKDGPTGPQAFRDYYATLRSAVSDARYEVNDLIAENDRVVVRWRMLGTHTGDFGGIAASGKGYRAQGHRHLPGGGRYADGALGCVRPAWRP